MAPDRPSPRPATMAAALPQLNDDDPIWRKPGPRTHEEVDTRRGFIDMGSLRIPAVPGMQVQTQVADDGSTVLRTMLVLGTSGLQISVAAAPKSGGVWDEVRDEIHAALNADGAKVVEKQTRYGMELLADVPVTTPDGGSATSRMRIIGREGPRWFARIDILGPAATSFKEAEPIEKVIDRLVIVRDEHPRARLDLLPLHMPHGIDGVTSD